MNRTLEGLTWLDDSADGIQNEAAERRISGVKVTLLKLKDGGDPANESDYEPYHYQGDSNLPEVVIETGQIVSVRANSSADATDYELGRYKFIDLPAGTFAVRFEDGTTKISPLIASPSNHGTDDTQDSDGIATYSTDRSSLKQTVILGIELPRAEDDVGSPVRIQVSRLRLLRKGPRAANDRRLRYEPVYHRRTADHRRWFPPVV